MMVQASLFGTGAVRILNENKPLIKTVSQRVHPWDGVCCEACWMAREKECACRCHGRNHGAGLVYRQRKQKSLDMED